MAGDALGDKRVGGAGAAGGAAGERAAGGRGGFGSERSGCVRLAGVVDTRTPQGVPVPGVACI